MLHVEHFTKEKWESILKWGEVNSDDCFISLSPGPAYVVEPGQNCTTTAKFATGYPFLVLPPPSYTTLPKDDTGSIFG
jgi:hypothetical protein